MTDPAEIPEPDRAQDAPHPRQTPQLYGHAAAEARFLQAFNAGRLHHAWLITGPRGVGKATLAWRLARFLLATPRDDGAAMFAPAAPDSLDIAADHPVARRVAALSDPGLFLLRRPWDERTKRLKQEITVDAARQLKGFFNLSASGGGRRVVIVDAADELNNSAANAILKLLEEPPADAVLLIVAHQPARLLPTIRSRCRELRLSPLGADDLTLALNQLGADMDAEALGMVAELAEGSVGRALVMAGMQGHETYRDLVGIFANAPQYDRPRAIKLAESTAGVANSARLALVVELIDLFLARLARHAAGRPAGSEAVAGEAALFARLAPSPATAHGWAALSQALGARAAHGRAVNLDPAALILDMIIKINQTAARAAA